MKIYRVVLSSAVTLVLFSLLLLPGNARAQEYVYQEDFEDGVAQDWTLDPGWQVIQDEGNYVLSGQGHTWARSGKLYDDYRLSFRLKILGGGGHLVPESPLFLAELPLHAFHLAEVDTDSEDHRGDLAGRDGARGRGEKAVRGILQPGEKVCPAAAPCQGWIDSSARRADPPRGPHDPLMTERPPERPRHPSSGNRCSACP